MSRGAQLRSTRQRLQAAQAEAALAEQRLRAAEQERDALRAEVQWLRLALAGAEECIELEQEAQQELRSAIGELLVETAEAQREACARATEETWPESPVRAARIRNTPLVTGNMP